MADAGPAEEHVTTWTFKFLRVSPATKTLVFRVWSLEHGVDAEVDMYGLTDVLLADGFPGVVVADAVRAAIAYPGDEIGLVKGKAGPL